MKKKHLESFIEIVRTGSVTEASKRLSLTQSAVSRQLAQLEEDLGIDLFHREKGRLIPLPEAQLLSTEADLILSGFDRIGQLASDLKNLNKGQLRVSGPPSFIEGVLVPVISTFLKTYPNIKFIIDSRNHETIVEQALCRAIDCGFVKAPISAANLHAESIFEAGTVCVMHQEHELAGLAHISPDTLDTVPLITLGQGKIFRKRLQVLFHEAGAVMNIRAETHAIGASCALASQGVGVAIVNEMLARNYENMDVAIVPFRPNIRHEYMFINSAQIPMSRLAMQFLEHCRHEMAMIGNQS